MNSRTPDMTTSAESDRPITEENGPRMPTDTTRLKLFKVMEVAALLGISRESVFGLLRTGQLGSVLIGKRGRRVTVGQLDAYLASLEGQPTDGRR